MVPKAYFDSTGVKRPPQTACSELRSPLLVARCWNGKPERDLPVCLQQRACVWFQLEPVCRDGLRGGAPQLRHARADVGAHSLAVDGPEQD